MNIQFLLHFAISLALIQYAIPHFNYKGMVSTLLHIHGVEEKGHFLVINSTRGF